MYFFTKGKNLKSNKSFQKNLAQIRQSPQYKENQKQIEIISKVLVENADVPQELVHKLIQSVQENASLEERASNLL